jgi:hypothetical protein
MGRHTNGSDEGSEAMSAKKAKFDTGQMVRVNKHYFKIVKREYIADRIAAWDNGWWYHEKGGSIYSEHAVRQLTEREKGKP